MITLPEAFKMFLSLSYKKLVALILSPSLVNTSPPFDPFILFPSSKISISVTLKFNSSFEKEIGMFKK